MLDNRLLRLAKKNNISESLIITFLQDFGIISDNCYKLDQVVDYKSAHKHIIKNWGEFTVWMK